ncbi:ankyrin repeat-containing protein BDA1-like [Cornus florida]|uniref:ankyrin repeat-containing protein BDA1-like n=1 Tax=Cornus florida TaxID=4283 RepID=UPI0028A1E11B|nr:ankyrin repeat-containing protein BDA1-like [Cornus florida]
MSSIIQTEQNKSMAQTEGGRERMRHLTSLLDVEKEEEIQIEKARERELHQAAINGTVTSLLELLHEYPLILDTITPPSSDSESDSVLHVAALLGHLDFARELLSRKPELAGELNSHGSSALHVASAKGYPEIVKELVLVDPDVCFVLDHDGMSPLHLAAIKGRVAVLTELVRVGPEAIRVLTGGGDTCFHLCVKYNRLEALKVLLVESVKKDEFVNWKDLDGNTILHIAVARKQLEIIKILLTNTDIEVNTRNGNGFTALDVLSKSPRDLRDMEIKECLHLHGATRIDHTPTTIVNIAKTPSTTHPEVPDSNNSITKNQQPQKQKHIDWLGRKRSSLMVVASLLATVAFQTGMSPPGGVWQDEYTVDSNGNPVKDPHHAGDSVMASNIPTGYGQFMIFNTIAFLASLSIILLLISGLPIKRRRWMWLQMVTMWIALTALAFTYFITLIHMTPKHVEGTLYHVTKISMLGWLSVMGIVFIGNVVRMLLWLRTKYRDIKEREPPNETQENENDENL